MCSLTPKCETATELLPSEKILNAKNLAGLGAHRRAEMLLEVTVGDAAAKRRLRLELASRGGDDTGGEIRKRLISIARSRSFVDWRKAKVLARDLDVQREAIATHLSPKSPGEAFDLLWRMLEIASSIYERCDDSNGEIGSVITSVRADLGAVATQAGQAPVALADRVFEAVRAKPSAAGAARVSQPEATGAASRKRPASTPGRRFARARGASRRSRGRRCADTGVRRARSLAGVGERRGGPA